MVPPITVGFWVKVFAFRVELVPLQKYRTKFAAMASALVTVAPVPAITVLTVSLLFASSLGILTVGVAPNAPPTVTDEFEFELLAPALELELELELGFDEPQPAMTRQASSGITVIARRRRMEKTSNVVGVRRSQPTGCVDPGGTTPLEPPDFPAVVLAVVPRGRGAVGPRGPRGLHTRYELFDPFVHGAERVLAQDGPLRLVVQLQVHPVNGEVTPLLLRPADELTTQLGPGRLRRNRLSLENVQVPGDPVHGAVALEQVVQAPAAAHVVVGQVQLSDPGRGQRQGMPGPVPLDQLVLGHPVDLPGDQVQVARLDRPQRPLPRLQHPLADRVEPAGVGEVLGPVQVLV